MDAAPPKPASTRRVTLVLAWLVVAIPLLWGVLQTLAKAAPLFQ